MKAAIIEAPGTPPVYGDFQEPENQQGRQIVELVAAGLHNVVRSLAEGRHYGSSGDYPLIPGVDAVARTSDGTLVYTGFPMAPFGTFAERIPVPAGLGFPLPEGADPAKVAAGMNPGLSSWLPLKSRLEEMGSLGVVLVLGATGMAGALALQNAKELGAKRVVGAGRNPDGLRRARALGATVAELTGQKDADAESIAAALNGDDPSLVLDFVWGGVAESAFVALGRRGLDEDTADIAYVQIGALGGAEASLPSTLLRSRRFHLSGTGMGSTSEKEMAEIRPAYIKLIADGRVEVPLRAFPLSQIAQAWEAARHSGPRVVLVPD